MHVTHAISNLKCTRLLEWSHALCACTVRMSEIIQTTYIHIQELCLCIRRSLTASPSEIVCDVQIA